jgi:hypothetical protein
MMTMEGNDEPAPISAPGADEPIRVSALLPGRVEEKSAVYERCLAELIDLLGVRRPPLISESREDRRRWQGSARRLIAQAAGVVPAREELFGPLVRAAVYEPDPSFNAEFVAPAVTLFGYRRVKLALIDYLANGSRPERVGAIRAWVWTQVRRSTTPTPEEKTLDDSLADLRDAWQETVLQVFVADDDLDLRRRLLPRLDLHVLNWPEAQRPTVEKAIRIAREHPDEYLRRCVEHQL